MKIGILLDGVVNKVLTTPFLRASINEDGSYTLEGETLKIEGVIPEQVLIVDDYVEIDEGDLVDDALLKVSMPIDSFMAVTAQRAAADALGLLMRTAVVTGSITDDELLRIAPAIAERTWQAGLPVEVGDVYCFGEYLWRCVQKHLTQSGWEPPDVPALWRKVEPTCTVRVWDSGIDYAKDDIVSYSNADSESYTCLQSHTSQAGWEPPNAPALWVKGEDDIA